MNTELLRKVSEILLTISIWIAILLLARDPYHGRKKWPLVSFGLVNIAVSLYWINRFDELEWHSSDLAGIVLSVFVVAWAWAFCTKTQATIRQHGELALSYKFGPPKLRLESLEDQELANKVRLSGKLMWSSLAVWLLLLVIDAST